MNISRLYLSATLLVIFFLGTISNTWAQRNVQYRDLVMGNQQRPVSFNFITLPGDDENTVKFTSVFSLSYRFLPFKKVADRTSQNNFFSAADLSLEVFKAEKSSEKKKRSENNISVEGLEPAGRGFWADTAYAMDYEMSQSNEHFLSGFLDVSLEPGSYNYVLQMKRGDQTESRISRARSVTVESYKDMKTGNVIIGKSVLDDRETPQFHLNSMGNDVEYAKDFYALAYIPGYETDATYNLRVISLEVSDQDTSSQQETYKRRLKSEDIRTGLRPKIASDNGNIYLNLTSDENGFAYALVKVPNSNFQNALYRLVIEKENEKKPVAEGTFRSLWVGMPASLLNLDVAVDMLKFIADKSTIKKISEGTAKEREKKFRAFWEKRDPTPDTEFNELMAEYYRRIDYAYKNFSTETRVGYESDQGEVYIKFGPPKNIDRKFPTDGATTEIWTYPNRKFVFKATSGFGDFKLVSDQSK